MIVAFVLAGKASHSQPGNYSVAPPGYDSIIEPNVMCIVYKEYQAYPAFVIRYR